MSDRIGEIKRPQKGTDILDPCQDCERVLTDDSAVETGRLTCFGKAPIPKGMDKIDEWNYCITTPYKGMIRYRVYPGDFELEAGMALAIQALEDEKFDMRTFIWRTMTFAINLLKDSPDKRSGRVAEYLNLLRKKLEKSRELLTLAKENKDE